MLGKVKYSRWMLEKINYFLGMLGKVKSSFGILERLGLGGCWDGYVLLLNAGKSKLIIDPCKSFSSRR